ncbi:MAG: P-II family nitrogen regulator [Chloroflexi bacterium]|nr:P-II family nitrogen regulator [Chloroflexota bacterium]
MNYMVLLVLHEVERLEQVLDAWEEAGVGGITLLATTGIGRIREKHALRDDLPLIPSLADLLMNPHEELLNRTIFSIVDSEEMVDRLVEATERITGSLDLPHTGIIAVLPVARVHGLRRKSKKD